MELFRQCTSQSPSGFNLFVDTNELLDVCGPENSRIARLSFGKLRMLSRLHEFFDMKIYVSEVVLKELTNNVYLSVTRELKASNDLVGEMQLLFPENRAFVLLPSVSRDELKTAIRESLVRAAIEIIPCSILEKKDLQTLIEDASVYQTPFEPGKEKGFKDECILLSYSSFISANHLEKSVNFCLTQDKQMQNAIKTRVCFSFLQSIASVWQLLGEKADKEIASFVTEICRYMSEEKSNSFGTLLKKYLGNGFDDSLGDFDQLTANYVSGSMRVAENPAAEYGLLSFQFNFSGFGRISFFDGFDDIRISTLIGSANGKGTAVLSFKKDKQSIVIVSDSLVFGSDTQIDLSTIQPDNDYYSELADEQAFEQGRDFAAEKKTK